MAKQIVIVSTLDTKGAEALYLKEQIERWGHKGLLVDVGVFSDDTVAADVSHRAVAEAGGSSIEQLIADAESGKDRSAATSVMMNGVKKITRALYEQHALDGIISLGGSTGTTLALAAMMEIPVGVPKLMVTTSAFFAMKIGEKDITVMQTPADILGLNAVLMQSLASAAGAICGMVSAPAPVSERRLIALTAMGVTTTAVMKTCKLLEEKGYDTIVFHSKTGNLSELVEQGKIDAIVDLTLSEMFTPFSMKPPGPLYAQRLHVAGEKGIPQIIAPGGLDMLVFRGSERTIPEKYQGRRMSVHGPQIMLVRTSEEELRDAGRAVADRINRATGPVAVLLPTRGFSDVDMEGRAFYDPELDRAFADGLREALNGDTAIYPVDANLTDDLFAERAVELLEKIIK